MVRTRLAILGSVSAITLLAATASQALTPPVMNLGTLKPTDQWKVGTVNAKGLSYCAMVNKFDKQVVLAFARSPEGYGSLAMDFRQNFFTPGVQYEVTLRPESGKTRRLAARASSERSVVVQIGQDEPLFKELAGNGDIEIGLPTIDASFALRKFSDSYADLIDCAAQIGKQAAAATPASGIGKSLIDEEVEDITAGKAAAHKGKARTKTDEFADMEAQLDREAAEEVKTSGKKIAALDTRKQELEQQIEDKQNRKLLASTETETVPAVPAEASGEAAREIERRQMARLEEARKASAELKAAVDGKQKQLAALEAAKADAADGSVAGFSRQDQGLKAKIASVEKKRDAVAVKAEDDDSKGLKAQLVALQGQVADLKQQRSAETAALTQKLAASQKEYESRISTLQFEREALKQKLAASGVAPAQQVADAGGFAGKLAAADLREKVLQSKLDATGGAKGGKAEVAELNARLKVSQDNQREIRDRLAAVERQNKLMEITIGQQNEKLAAGGGSKGGKLAALEKTHAEETARLQKKIDAEAERYAALEKEYEGVKLAATGEPQKKLVEAQGLIASLQSRLKIFETANGTKGVAAEVARLQDQLKQVEAERRAEAARAGQARADLADARQQLADLGKGLAPGAQVAQLEPSERAELEEYRRHGGTTRQAQAVAPPAVVSAPVVAEVALPASAPRKKLASTASASGDDAFLTEPPILSQRPGVAPAIAKAEEKTVAEIEPASGSADTVASAPVKAESESIVWDKAPHGYGEKPAPQEEKTADNFPVPAVPVESVDAAPVVPSTNRAAAFLDRIMAYHRPGAAAPPAEEAPAVAEEKPKKAPVRAVEAAKPPATARRLAAIETGSGRPEQPAVVVPQTPPRKIEFIAPPSQAKELPVAPVPQKVAAVPPPPPAPELPPKIVSAPVPPPVQETKKAEVFVPYKPEQQAVAPVIPAVATAPAAVPVTLGSLLSSAGLHEVAFTPAQPGGVHQWTSGHLSGLLEQQPVSGTFGAAVEAYLNRYRDDCRDLKVSAGESQSTPAGTLAVATASCAAPGNSYISSFVFLQGGSTFSAILHTGVPAEAAEVRLTGDRVAETLRASAGLAVPQDAPPAAPLMVQAAAVPPTQLRFNIPALPATGTQKASVSYTASGGEFETAIVQ